MKKLFISLFFILSLFLADGRVFADNIKFVQVTDAHITAGSEYSLKVLKSAVDDINKQQGVSFVVFTGDTLGGPKEENLREFLKVVNKLKVPYYVALGNHDVYKSNGLSKTRFYEIMHEKNLFYPQRKANYKFTKDKFVFLIVDGAKEVIPGPIGYYREDTLKWVEKELNKNSKKDVVIFQHFPIEYPEGVDSRLKTHRTYKVEQYRDMIDEHHNVLAVISGHFHVNSENMRNGVYHISTPALIALPQAYKIIDIVTTKDFSPIIYTQLREFEVKD